MIQAGTEIIIEQERMGLNGIEKYEKTLTVTDVEKDPDGVVWAYDTEQGLVPPGMVKRTASKYDGQKEKLDI